MPQRTKKKWTTFTYVSKQTRFITKLLKNMQVNIAYRTNNAIKHLLSHNPHNQTTKDKFQKIRVYQLNCKDSLTLCGS